MGRVWVNVRVSGLGLQADVPLALRMPHNKPENREVNEMLAGQNSSHLLWEIALTWKMDSGGALFKIC